MDSASFFLYRFCLISAITAVIGMVDHQVAAISVVARCSIFLRNDHPTDLRNAGGQNIPIHKALLIFKLGVKPCPKREMPSRG